MWGAVQLGVLAAFLVLFVPIGMAGWHLSRNKMLFFSCALFITLSVCVHLTPYFPSVSNMLFSSGSTPLSSSLSSVNLDSCISLLHQVSFDFQELNDNVGKNNSWKWIESEPVVQCGFQKLNKSDASDLFNGSWVVIAGDSQARLFVVSVLELLLRGSEMEMIRGDLFKRHSDYNIFIDEIGMKLDFIWAPYVSNLTDLVLGFEEKKSYPDVFVIGTGLWDMLHINNATDYGVSLKLLADLVVLLLPVPSDFGANLVSVRSPNFFWLGMPKLINLMLNTNEKREKMTDEMWQAYTDELYSSKLLRQSGGPLVLLDIHALSNKCGARCTTDGMHYHGVVYEAAVHVMLNGLLIESNQKL
ncbi:protein ALTERED XYLOGLUCAN 9-like [Lycium barbarum]|uniref:protein ALTERED XYLOGLUCAN 9-like n=1 Tax=Lycium barbarum TaxID=112863 RepID=UPI00293E0F7B|nr:protein ALTERED XYLOGLUCAN 9-like [Lycium barbarum]XP_060196081.1 protein ALTERED XYLOGLUCAN 9-like [Lycium barbarum]